MKQEQHALALALWVLPTVNVDQCDYLRMLLAGLKVYALDAAMPFDYEAKANAKLKQQTALRIGIVGFGTFGQFLAKRLVQKGHKASLPFFS